MHCQNANTSIKQLLIDLVSIQSDTGTQKELHVESFILDWISQLDYFKTHTDHYGYHAIPEDPYHRKIIWGLVKGTSHKTIVLVNHHDVVDAFDYGSFKAHAYTPESLHYHYQNLDFPDDVKSDLHSKDWLFGRGTADMKAGIAIQLGLLKRYSFLNHFEGNLLFISVPDEESLSVGMRNGALLLNSLRDQFQLNYQLLINSEPHQRTSQDEACFYEGSVGKTMAVIYVKGYKTHIGQIFEGMNPAFLLSHIVQKTEMNPQFSDIFETEVSPPPSWSFCRDFKACYDASIPEAAGGYLSFLTMQRTPSDILTALKTICYEAFEETLDTMNQHYRRFQKNQGLAEKELPWMPLVYTFSELYEEAQRHAGNRIDQSLREQYQSLCEAIRKGKCNIPESNFPLIETLIEHLPHNRPLVVIAFSPPYYPHIANNAMEQLDPHMRQLGPFIDQYARDHLKQNYLRKHYFMGISDLSYTGLQHPEKTKPYIESNMPLWGDLYTIPFDAMETLQFPIINIGPWGKDYHKMTERVYMPDVETDTPELIKAVIDYALDH